MQVANLAQLTVVDRLLRDHDPRVIEQEVPDHQRPPVAFGDVAQLLAVGDGQRERLLDEYVAPRFQRAPRQPVVASGVDRQRDRADFRIAQQIVVRWRDAYPRMLRGHPRQQLGAEIAHAAQVGPPGGRECPDDVAPPAGRANDADT